MRQVPALGATFYFMHVVIYIIASLALSLSLLLCTIACRVWKAELGVLSEEWVLQSVFEAGPLPCSALCWRGSSSGLSPMLLTGTGQGAQVEYPQPPYSSFLRKIVLEMSTNKNASKAVMCIMQVFCYAGRSMTWQPVARLGSGHITDVGWASVADGEAAEYVAAAAGNTVTIWQLSGRADQLEVQAHVSQQLPVWVTISTQCRPVIHLQHVACTQAEEVATLQHSGEVCQVSWSSLGTLLATVTKDSSVHLWRPNLGGEWGMQSKICASYPESEYVMVD